MHRVCEKARDGLLGELEATPSPIFVAFEVIFGHVVRLSVRKYDTKPDLQCIAPGDCAIIQCVCLTPTLSCETS
jgi:hypothetical protein